MRRRQNKLQVAGCRLQDARRRLQDAGCWLHRNVTAVLFFLLASILPNFGAGQSVSTTLTKEKIVIGEQTVLEIKVESIRANMIRSDFSIPDSVNHIEVLSHQREEAGQSVILYTLTLTSFDSGYWEIPPMEMTLTDQRKLSTGRIGISVVPVDVSGMADYHDIKDILEIQPANNWWIIGGIVALALIALFGFLWFMNRRQPTSAAIERSPLGLQQRYDKLIKTIRELSMQDISDRAVVLRIFDESTEDIRRFSDAVWEQNTRHYTISEYMLKTKGKIAPPELENKYFQYLRLSNAVKFAKYFPPADETQAIFPLLEEVAGALFHQIKARR